MSKHQSPRSSANRRWLGRIRDQVLACSGRLWHRLRQWPKPVPIEVLVADRTRRCALERELRWGIGRLRRALGEPFPNELTVLVQQVVRTDRPLAGCYLLGQHPGGRRFALVRLALEVDGHRLTSDELLAVLAEQLIGLATQQTASVLVPIDFSASPAAPGRTAPVLRSDPLAPRTNGASHDIPAA